MPSKRKRADSTNPFRDDCFDIVNGLTKEVALVGLYAVKELTGADLHHNTKRQKRPWEKKWGQR